MTITMTTPGDVEPVSARSDIGSQLDVLPVGRVHRKVVVAIGLGLFFEVYEIFLSSSIATALKTEYHLGGTALPAADGFVVHRNVHRCSRIRPHRRPHRPTKGLPAEPGVVLGVQPAGRRRTHAGAAGGGAVPGRHRHRRRIPGRRLVSVRRAAESRSWTAVGMGVHLLVPGRARAGLPGARPVRPDRSRRRRVAGAATDRRRRRGVRDVVAARTTRVAALARRKGPHGRGPGSA